jgi:hypothetical protein
MTGLLVGTFLIAGLHTLLWFPRSLEWRRKLKKIHDDEQKSAENNSDVHQNETEKKKE